MCGFTEKDIRMGLEKMIIKEKSEIIFQMMKENYEGYKFHWEEEEKIFNPTFSIYFMKNLFEQKMIPKEKNLLDNQSLELLNKFSFSPFSYYIIINLLSNIKKGVLLKSLIEEMLYNRLNILLKEKEEIYIL